MNEKQENMIVQYTKDYYKYSLTDDGFRLKDMLTIGMNLECWKDTLKTVKIA